MGLGHCLAKDHEAVKRLWWILGFIAGPLALMGNPFSAAGDRALDFWLGDWEVFLAEGPKDGDNRIEKMLGGFAVQENWTERDGHEGKSWFYYCGPEKRWKQVWVTDTGGGEGKGAGR
jgi:hypothetical protein